jgi:competence protein ComEC
MVEKGMSRPIIPILTSYIIGLIAGYYLTIPFHVIIALLFISASLTAVSVLFRNFSAIFFTFSVLTLFILGVGRMEAVLRPSFPDNHITNLISDEPMSLEGTVCEPPERGLDRVRFYVDLSTLYIGDTPYPLTGKLLLTIGNTTLEGRPIPTPTLPLKGREFQKLRYGDTIRFLAKVRRPRNFHNPGGFDYERYLALRGIFATAYLKSAEGIVKINEGGPSFNGWIEQMRGAIRDNVFRNAGTSAPILLALVTGEQGEIPKETREAFSRAGTAHILAISGEHIGLITAASFFIFLWLLKRSERVMLKANIYKAAAVMTIPWIALYSLIAGGGFSIVRAAIMGGTVLTAVFHDRRRDIPSLIASAAFLILVFEPQGIFDISFQLSFASVISLALASPYLKGFFDGGEAGGKAKRDIGERILAWVYLLMAASIAAALGTSPLVAHYFNRLSIISPISNLITVPVVGFLVVPLGLLSSILIPVSQGASGLLISIDSHLISLIERITSLLSSIPAASVRVVTPNILEITLFYLIFTLFIFRERLKQAKPAIITLLASLAALETFYLVNPLFQKDLRVTFLDVGQGESALIEFPGGKRMLIDGGGMTGDFDIGERAIAPFLWHKRIRSIDYLVLSHPNSDHYSGLPFILKNFMVGEVWEGGIEERSNGYRDFKKAVAGSGSLYKRVSEGDRYNINNTTVEVLNAPNGFMATDDKAANNGSLVLKFRYGDTSFLFTGDIEKEAEYRLLPKGDILKSTVLKVPHHGSLTSSTVDFLDRVKPEKAVFSVGYKNSFGFPKEAVLKRYREIGSEIYRTDRDGAIMVESNGSATRLSKTLNSY